ncbi:MAG: MaoC family dehydratase [Chloroflexi bacterium]|nr:MaoC family dehydratase [Chloroflexota bacterium]
MGFELPGVKKQMVIQLMGSSAWGRTNPIHWDYETSVASGLPAPIATGQMSTAYLGEMLVQSFGEAVFKGSKMQCKYISPIFAGDTVTAKGVVRETTPVGGHIRFKVEMWVENQDGKLVTVGSAEITV